MQATKGKGMSLRGGRQADEAIPRPPGRRLLRCARKDIKDIKSCLCEQAARLTKQSPLSQVMSLRGGRQADEAIPLPLGRRLLQRVQKKTHPRSQRH